MHDVVYFVIIRRGDGGGDIYLLHILIINEITNDDTFNSLLDAFPHHRIHFSRFKKHYNQLLTFPTR